MTVENPLQIRGVPVQVWDTWGTSKDGPGRCANTVHPGPNRLIRSRLMPIVTPAFPPPVKTCHVAGRTLSEHALARLWGHVDATDECWLWTSALSHNGYPTFFLDGTVRAHRLIYELCVGPIPDGLVLDHLCRVRRCVRLDHLEPVTCKVNTNRSPHLETGAWGAARRKKTSE